MTEYKSLAHQLAERFVELRSHIDETERLLRSYKDLMDLCPVPVWMSDSEGLTTYVNPAYCRLFGVKPEAPLVFGWRAYIVDAERVYFEWTSAVRAQLPHIQNNIQVHTAYGDLPCVYTASRVENNGYVGFIVPEWHLSGKFPCLDSSAPCPFAVQIANGTLLQMTGAGNPSEKPS